MKMNPGMYLGELTEMFTSQNTNGTPFMASVFAISHIAQNGQWVPIQPETRTVRLFLTDKAIDFSMEKLKTLGFNGDFANPKWTVTEGVTLTCEHKSGQGENAGKTYENWDLFSERQEQERIPIAGDAVRQLSARWRSKYGTPAPARTAPPAARLVPARQPAPAPAQSTAPLPQVDPAADAGADAYDENGNSIPF